MPTARRFLGRGWWLTFVPHSLVAPNRFSASDSPRSYLGCQWSSTTTTARYALPGLAEQAPCRGKPLIVVMIVRSPWAFQVAQLNDIHVIIQYYSTTWYFCFSSVVIIKHSTSLHAFEFILLLFYVELFKSVYFLHY